LSEKLGFIKLYRSILDDDLWLDDEPFDIRSAFIDLVLLANYKASSVYNRPVSRGQHWTSLRKLSQRWHIDRRTVKHNLELMQLDGKITFEASNRGVLITVVNYSKWQKVELSNTTKCTTECTTKYTTGCTTKCTQTRIDKEFSKEDKEIKASPSSFDGDRE